MFLFFQKKRAKKYLEQARAYVRLNLVAVRYALPDSIDIAADMSGSDRILQSIKMCLAEGDTAMLDQLLQKNLGRTFSEQLRTYINARNAKDSEIYRAAQIDRRLYSKILSDRFYKPSKDTSLALAFALELSFVEALDLLARAGYTLSHSDERDILIEYFLKIGVRDLNDINAVLYTMGKKIIGRI